MGYVLKILKYIKSVYAFFDAFWMRNQNMKLDNEIDRKIDVTAIQFLLVQNRQQTHDWTLSVSGANELGVQEWDILQIVVIFTCS